MGPYCSYRPTCLPSLAELLQLLHQVLASTYSRFNINWKLSYFRDFSLMASFNCPCKSCSNISCSSMIAWSLQVQFIVVGDRTKVQWRYSGGSWRDDTHHVFSNVTHCQPAIRASFSLDSTSAVSEGLCQSVCAAWTSRSTVSTRRHCHMNLTTSTALFSVLVKGGFTNFSTFIHQLPFHPWDVAFVTGTFMKWLDKVNSTRGIHGPKFYSLAHRICQLYC